MSKTCLVYRGFTIEAEAFELAGTDRFISSLTITMPGSVHTLVDLPVTHHIFSSSAEAMSMTLAQGRTPVDFLGIDPAEGLPSDE